VSCAAGQPPPRISKRRPQTWQSENGDNPACGRGKRPRAGQLGGIARLFLKSYIRHRLNSCGNKFASDRLCECFSIRV
jgi:hypothetical protein